MKKGDTLLNKDKQPLVVASLEGYGGYNPTEKAQEGYGITVAMNHTFFAGEQSVLMHNCGGKPGAAGESSPNGSDIAANSGSTSGDYAASDGVSEGGGSALEVGFSDDEGRMLAEHGLAPEVQSELTRLAEEGVERDIRNVAYSNDFRKNYWMARSKYYDGFKEAYEKHLGYDIDVPEGGKQQFYSYTGEDINASFDKFWTWLTDVHGESDFPSMASKYREYRLNHQ